MDDQVAKLLLKAVRTLPQREQDQVLRGLFRSALAEPVPPTRAGQPPSMIMLSESPPAIGAPGQSAMLPVRLPPELHERLRRWSTAHGFSMAGVVRGLVERFLDQQGRTPPPKRRAAARPKAKRTTARG
jgi:hypothetical protein